MSPKMCIVANGLGYFSLLTTFFFHVIWNL